MKLKAPITAVGVLALILLHTTAIGGQSSDAQREYEALPLESRGFEEKDWKKAIAGLDFNEKKRKPKSVELPGSPGWGLFQDVAKVLVIVTGAIALALILYFFFVKTRSPANKRVEKMRGIVFNPDKLEEEVLDAPFEDYIREALQQGQYALAIRLQYLWALQTLARRELISWKKDKTNREFLAELRSTPFGAPFSEATAVYEWVWYGGQPLSQQYYEQYAHLFTPLTVDLAVSPEKSIA